MDTVGAVCMDGDGHLCAGVSSGGVVYKTPGRIGQVSFRLSLYCDNTGPLGSANTQLHFFLRTILFLLVFKIPGGVVFYMGSIGMCGLKGYGFSADFSHSLALRWVCC